MSATIVTYPLAALLEESRLTRSQIAPLVRANGSVVRRCATEGLTRKQADLWANRLGLHPGSVWENWWTEE